MLLYPLPCDHQCNKCAYREPCILSALPIASQAPPVDPSVSGSGGIWALPRRISPRADIWTRMTGNFARPQRPSPQFAHYENVLLLGPPTMRGAIVFSGS